VIVDRDELKRAAAARAVELVENGMVLGLGSGTTAAFVVRELAGRVARGLDVVAIPTSEETAALARQLGIRLATFAEHRRIDLAIDGADEVHRGTLDVIKGRGGALLREKIVATASARFVVVVDNGKLVDRLGMRMPVPVEVVRFGWQATAAALEGLGAAPRLRERGEQVFVTDGGNVILDCRLETIDDPAEIERRLNAPVGVVENGLFVGRTSQVIVASESGVEIMIPGAGKSR
jgi:ribose 5-phosphate isomerase A